MSDPRPLLLDAAAAEPLYGQIAVQLRERIARGELAPGADLPSVRTLASDLGVNLNTVARAYRLLEEEGFVLIRERAGVEVAPPAAKADAATGRALGEQLRDLLARMRQAGVAPEAVRALVEGELQARPRREPPARAAAADPRR